MRQLRVVDVVVRGWYAYTMAWLTLSPVDNSLKSLIIDTVDPVFLQETANRYTGYLGVSARDLITHLLARYGKITISDCLPRSQHLWSLHGGV